MNKKFYALVVLGVLLIAGALGGIFYYTKGESKKAVTTPERQRANLSGEYLCLKSSDELVASERDCVVGLKTDDGKYYALDFNLSSQTPPKFVSGDRLQASGVITSMETISSNQWQTYNLAGIFSVTDSVQKLNKEPIAYMCNGDGKVCWDGSVVGRTGTDCQFQACPLPQASSTIVYTSLGQTSTGLNVSLTPKEVVSDSRCPSQVQCVWAGTVEVRTVMATKVSHGEHVLKIDVPQVFGDYVVTLVQVTPDPKAGVEIPSSSYRFEYEVKEK